MQVAANRGRVALASLMARHLIAVGARRWAAARTAWTGIVMDLSMPVAERMLTWCLIRPTRGVINPVRICACMLICHPPFHDFEQPKMGDTRTVQCPSIAPPPPPPFFVPSQWTLE